MDILTDAFLEGIVKQPRFESSLATARRNAAGGNIWVIGGQVYRTIIAALSGQPAPISYDFDFIIECPVGRERFYTPEGWQLTQTGARGHAPRLTKDDEQIDLVPLDLAVNPFEPHEMNGCTADQKLQSYFRRVPLDIQSLAFDCDARKVIGNVGRQALDVRRISVNNLNECLEFCHRRKISIRKFIDDKCKAMGFEAVYPVFGDKTSTVAFYDAHAARYNTQRGGREFISQWLGAEAQRFVSNLREKRILDLGSGPGHHSVYLRQLGAQPVCVDASLAMVEACRGNDLEAHVKDMEDLDFSEKSFGGVWAYASLVHVPKARLSNTLARIREILVTGGEFFVGMIEGQGEVMYQSSFDTSRPRSFSLYLADEFRAALERYFQIRRMTRIEVPVSGKGKEVYLNFTCQA